MCNNVPMSDCEHTNNNLNDRYANVFNRTNILTSVDNTLCGNIENAYICNVVNVSHESLCESNIDSTETSDILNVSNFSNAGNVSDESICESNLDSAEFLNAVNLSNVSNVSNVEETNTNGSISTHNTLKTFRSKHPKNLIFAHLNINSIRNKFCEIYDVMNNNYVDIFGISETKLDDSFTNAQFNIQNFKIYRKDRNARGGGLMLYVRSDIPNRNRPDLECSTHSQVEHIILETILKKQKMLFVLLYSPPNVKRTDLVNVVNDLFDKCHAECNNVFLMGDLNVDFTLSNHALADYLQLHGVKNIINGFTCY